MSRIINIPEQKVTTFTVTESATLARLACPTGPELTISGGTITVANTIHTVDTEGNAPTDDLTTINGGVDGQILIISPASSNRTVVVKDGATLKLAGDFSMDHGDDRMTLVYRASAADWFELSRSDNAV